MNVFELSHKLSSVVLSAGVVFSAAALNAQTTWTGGTGDWTVSGNWSAGVPTSAQNANIQSGAVTLGATGDARALFVGSDPSAIANLTITLGATLSIGGASTSRIGSGTGASGTVTQTGGSVTINSNNYLDLGGTSTGGTQTGGSGTYSISGGSLTISHANGIQMGGNNNGSATSVFKQSGGVVTLGSLAVGANRSTGSSGSPRVNNATYTISGGTLAIAGNLTQATTSTTGTLGSVNGTTKVVGSAATITVGGNVTLNHDGSKNTSTLSFAIDNGGVSKINLTGTGTAALAGTLKAGFKGGIALTATDSFTLLEANTGNISGSFGTGPDSGLWTVATSSVGGGRDGVTLALAGAANKGGIAFTGSSADASFSASSTGYVTFTGLGAGDDINLYLAASAGTGKSVSDLVTYLNSNGIAATAISENGYSVLVTTEASAASSWFAWDLRDFNADAVLSGVGIGGTAIPEPSTAAMLVGIGALAASAARRRR
jgi:hypothetical protein